VRVALLQIRYAAAGQFGLEVLVATRRLQAAIIAGWAQKIARVMSSYGVCGTAGCGRQGDDCVTSIADRDVDVANFVRMS
jgi:hypothetical protein